MQKFSTLFCIFFFLLQNEAGKMLLEGTLCPDFYLIQDLLYKQYAII